MLAYLCSVGSFLKSVLYIILALLVLMIMIVIHEFGHYTAGKIFKFKINEFSIGFGKAIFKKTKKNGEVFAIRCIPLGGYCAFEGEDEDGNVSPDAFNNKPWWQRIIVLFCGAFFNFLSAIIFSVVLLCVIGSGLTKIETVSTLPSQYVDSAYTLQQGDVIKKVNGKTCTFLNGGFNGMVGAIKNNTEVITLTIERVVDGKAQDLEVKIKKCAYTANNQLVETETNDENLSYLIGVTNSYYNYSFGKALLKAVPFCFSIAWECLVILGKLLIGQYSIKNLGGPITTINTIATASSQNMLNLILLFPLIAVNLAVFNLLPIPALDGMRMVFVLIEAIRKKPINRDVEAKIHGIGLMVLFGFVIIVDILKLFVFRWLWINF